MFFAYKCFDIEMSHIIEISYAYMSRLVGIIFINTIHTYSYSPARFIRYYIRLVNNNAFHASKFFTVNLTICFP